ncbi:four helix bundle protein [Pirellulales bacterium]|nr:four helix bundle protein [Pirellulales bacterium]
MSYRKLEIWRLAGSLVTEIHKMSLEQLPKFEMYEEGSQIRRSIKSVKSNIVEGYGRRRYKKDFIRFLTYSHASCDETVDHLETLFETKSLTNQPAYSNIRQRLDQLGGMINHFIQSVDSGHQTK